MARKKIKTQIKQLKKDLRNANKATDYRLLKLTVVMLVLAAIVAFIYGRIHL